MKSKTPLKAIRDKCFECCNNQVKEIRLCPVELCPLWEYRFGHKPKNSAPEENQ